MVHQALRLSNVPPAVASSAYQTCLVFVLWNFSIKGTVAIAYMAMHGVSLLVSSPDPDSQQLRVDYITATWIVLNRMYVLHRLHPTILIICGYSAHWSLPIRLLSYMHLHTKEAGLCIRLHISTCTDYVYVPCFLFKKANK